MSRLLLILFVQILFFFQSNEQGLVQAAQNFIQVLNAPQKAKALYPFDAGERYNFHFFPKDDRKGIALEELTPDQQKAALQLMTASFSR